MAYEGLQQTKPLNKELLSITANFCLCLILFCVFSFLSDSRPFDAEERNSWLILQPTFCHYPHSLPCLNSHQLIFNFPVTTNFLIELFRRLFGMRNIISDFC